MPDLLYAAFRRREWAAALRWEADQLSEVAERAERTDLRKADANRYYASVLEIDAHRIESGTLTPWADTPEPATEPEPATPPLATDEPPCWLPDAHGEPLCVREFERVPCDDCPTPSARKPATPPAEAAQEPPEFVFDSDHAGNLWIGCGRCNADIREVEEGDLLDQILTAAGAHRCDPNKPPRRRAVRCSCGAALVAENAEEWAHQTEDGYGNDGCDEPLPISDERERLHQDLADAETRADRAEAQCIDLQARLQWAQVRQALAAAVDALTGGRSPSTDPTSPSSGDEGGTKPTPEPAGDGPGWDRLWGGLQMLVTALPSATWNEPNLAQKYREQLAALLADWDRLAAQTDPDAYNEMATDLARAEEERDAARAELAEATAEQDRLHGLAARAMDERSAATTELERLRRRDGVLLIKPDEDQLAIARRDGAAATLDWAAGPGTDSKSTTLRQWAAEIRTGQRDTPGTEAASNG